MAYGDLKDLAKTSHKVLCDKAFNIKNNPKMMDINAVLFR